MHNTTEVKNMVKIPKKSSTDLCTGDDGQHGSRLCIE